MLEIYVPTNTADKSSKDNFYTEQEKAIEKIPRNVKTIVKGIYVSARDAVLVLQQRAEKM